MPPIFSVEHKSKPTAWDIFQQAHPSAFSRDLALWWAKARGKPNPFLKIGETDHSNREGEES